RRLVGVPGLRKCLGRCARCGRPSPTQGARRRRAANGRPTTGNRGASWSWAAKTGRRTSRRPSATPCARRGTRFTTGAPEPALIFCASPAEFRAWLAENHATATELHVGFYRKGSGKPSMTWQESVDEALCFGWIDSVRRKVDEDGYYNRFTP